MTIRIILASQSPYRKRLLLRLGKEFSQVNSGIDENRFKENSDNPYELSRELSLAKARSVAQNYSGQFCVIGADQVCAMDKQIFHKPGQYDKAFQQLSQMQGKIHQLNTSYALVTGQTEIIYTQVTQMHMRPLSAKQIQAYLERERPYDTAGSYYFEKGGISLFSKIECDDPSGIEGLPLINLSFDFIKLGIIIP